MILLLLTNTGYAAHGAENNTLIVENQKLRIDTGRLQELVTNLQSSAAPGGKANLNPYLTMPMVTPSPLEMMVC